MLMNSHRFEDAAKSIFALCPGITAIDDDDKFAMQIKYTNASYTVKPFPPERVRRFVIGESLPNVLLIRLIICFIRLGRKNLAPQLYLDVARAYHSIDCIAHAQKYMEHLLDRAHFANNAEAWYLYGLFLGPSHVDARINYSTMQQRLGLFNEAFETLRDYVLDAGSTLPYGNHLLYLNWGVRQTHITYVKCNTYLVISTP
ncbi:unnamed protein product [Gongylonema pulchrum]|uniref:Uncharacterized protein n=1 Tax=Gongylonema pulchrum TaxID=637853 RepID=A0A3P7R5Y8_9BILA|nr:unnamed protein product [Gongylonema pulchrum]